MRFFDPHVLHLARKFRPLTFLTLLEDDFLFLTAMVYYLKRINSHLLFRYQVLFPSSNGSVSSLSSLALDITFQFASFIGFFFNLWFSISTLLHLHQDHPHVLHFQQSGQAIIVVFYEVKVLIAAYILLKRSLFSFPLLISFHLSH